MKNINFNWIDAGLGARQANIQACQEGVMRAFKLDVITYLWLYSVCCVSPVPQGEPQICKVTSMPSRYRLFHQRVLSASQALIWCLPYLGIQVNIIVFIFPSSTRRGINWQKPGNVSAPLTFLPPCPALANSPFIRASPGDFRQAKLYLPNAYPYSPL